LLGAISNRHSAISQQTNSKSNGGKIKASQLKACATPVIFPLKYPSDFA
jgi:hypothetical protein